jgi:hypothetical protein
MNSASCRGLCPGQIFPGASRRITQDDLLSFAALMLADIPSLVVGTGIGFSSQQKGFLSASGAGGGESHRTPALDFMS